jgi:hypothetical protein
MPLLTTAAGIGARLVGYAARKAVDWGLSKSRPILRVTLEEIDTNGMLRAFDVTLTNGSDEPVRLRSLFISKPEGATFAIRWRPMMYAVEDGLRYEPWEHQTNYPLKTTLDPTDKYDCEIGLPRGFAITASRTAPVTISITMTTLGSVERTVTQHIERRISF